MGLLLVGPTASFGQSSALALKPTDVLNVREIRDATLSPSGRNVAYTVRQVTDTGSPTYRTQLYVGPASGRGSFRQLTRSEGAVTDPDWHPNGNRLAFVRPVDGTPQIFVLSLSGGEPYQLTDVPYGATHPQWSPSGDRLLFASSIPEPRLQRRSGDAPPSERPGRTPRDLSRQVPPDTLLVLRHAQTLDPVDTLALGPNGRPRLRSDTSRALRTPGGPSVPARLRSFPADSLRYLSPDSIRSIFDRLRLRPDTTTVAVAPDTTATPDETLLQTRRWMEQRPDHQVQVFTRPSPQTAKGLTPTPTYQHYFLVRVPDNVTTGRPAQPEATPVTHGYRSYQGAAWLPAGTQIVVSTSPPGTDHSDRVTKRSLYVVDLRPYRIHRLLQIDGYALSSPQVTSDGTTLAFRAQPLSAPTYASSEIGLFELNGRSAPQLITADFNRNIQTFRWSPDGWYLYATAPSHGGRPLYRFAPFARKDTSARRGQTSLRENYNTSRDTFALDSTMVQTAIHERVLDTENVVQAFDVTDSKVVYAALRPDNPSELYANTVSFKNENRLSSHNEAWATNRRLPSAERLTVWNDGFSIEGRVTRPLQSSNAPPAPLVVIPRGGPPALASGDPLSSWLERHYLAGQGYGVVEIWPRGSVGYGPSFRRANFQNWGPGPATDVLTAAETVASRPWADSTRQFLAGRAYGGYLTAYLLGASNRFRAAVAQNGVYDLETFFGGGASGAVIPAQFGGYPWEKTPPPLDPRLRPDPLLSAGLLPPPDSMLAPQRALRRSSPVAQTQQINTPLLLLHGGRNHRIGPAQPELFYRRLKTLERPVEYVRYPSVGHNFSGASPIQQIDRLVRLHEFFARYVNLDRQTAAATP